MVSKIGSLSSAYCVNRSYNQILSLRRNVTLPLCIGLQYWYSIIKTHVKHFKIFGITVFTHTNIEKMCIYVILCGCSPCAWAFFVFGALIVLGSFEQWCHSYNKPIGPREPRFPAFLSEIIRFIRFGLSHWFISLV